MKKLLTLFNLLFFLALYYPQTLHKVEADKKYVQVKTNFTLDKNYKVSAASFSESFESPVFPPTGWANFPLDGGIGWTRETIGTPLPMWSSNKIISSPPGGDQAVAYCTWNDSTIYSNQWLITPLINNIQPEDTLFFWMRNQVRTNDTIYIYYSSDGSTWNQIGHIYYPNNSDTNWGKWYNAIGESIPAGANAFLAIQEVVNDNLIDGGAICLDLFQIKGTQQINAPSAVTNQATNVTSSSATLNGVINPNNSPTDVHFEYGTTTAYGRQVTVDQGQLPAGTANVNVTATITGLQANTLYHFRVVAGNGGGTVNSADATFTTLQAVVYPTTINLNHSYTFTNLTQSSYRLIGLPGNGSTKISELVSGTQKKDWDAFFDKGGNTDNPPLKEFDGSASFNFIPGKGFWILSKNQFTVNATNVPTVALTGDNTFSIDLHTESGTIANFKIISNPFEKNVSWADVQNLNGLAANNFLFDWTGVWNHAAQMEPYKAYYFINPNNLTSLKIPYNFGVGKVSTTVSENKNEGNSIKLSLLQNKEEISSVVVGFDKTASKDYHKLDGFAPPGYFDEVRIHIEDQNISFPYKQLFTDFRPEINDGQTFSLKIKNTTDKSVKLSAEGINNFLNDEVYLFDENLHKFYNLKEQNEIEISPLHQNNNYQLLIGNDSYVNNIKKDYIPIEYGLYQNYPNPFNPSTVIKYQIPKDGLVEVKIYNVLGKEVTTLVNQIQEAGIHEVEFSASAGKADLSSGIYFYILKSGSFTSTKKMILIK